MIGKNVGCLTCLEAKLGRYLQWLICLLHLNEQPLSHIFHVFDGATSGPSSFSRPIGKQLDGSASTWAVENF